MVVDEAAAEAGIAALAGGAPVIVDVEMVRHGITGVAAECFLPAAAPADGRDPHRRPACAWPPSATPRAPSWSSAAPPPPWTRSSACYRGGRSRPPWWSACRWGSWAPPSPRSGCAPAASPSITNVGEKGGSAVAAAAVNVARSPAVAGVAERPSPCSSSATAAGRPPASPSTGTWPRVVAEARPRRSTSAAASSSWPSPTSTPPSTASSSAGATSVVAVPLVLLGAGHMKNDGPPPSHRGRHRHPGVRSPTAASSASTRSCSPWPRTGSAPPSATATRPRPPSSSSAGGRRDPDANADLYKVARLLWDSRGLAMVEPAFVSLAAPGVPAALERCRRLGATRIAVVPYFLFTGVLVDRIARPGRGVGGGPSRRRRPPRPAPRAPTPASPPSSSSATARRWPATPT